MNIPPRQAILTFDARAGSHTNGRKEFSPLSPETELPYMIGVAQPNTALRAIVFIPTIEASHSGKIPTIL